MLGLCPKCGGWFSCDDFFEFTVPTPCCPHCHLTPARVAYRFPPATNSVTKSAENAGGSSPAATTVTMGDATVAIDHPETTTATVVSVAGTLDAAPMTRLLDMLTAHYAHGDVIIDLNGVMMTSPSAIRSLVARLSAWADTATLRIVCDRLTARRLLRKWGGGALPLVSTMTAALDSLSPATVRRR